MTYAPDRSQQAHDGADYYGAGYSETQAPSPYHDRSYLDHSTYGPAYNQDYDNTTSQRPGTAAGFMQPSMRQHIASPSPLNNPESYSHHLQQQQQQPHHHHQQQQQPPSQRQQQYQEQGAVSGYYGAAQSFDLPSRPGTAPGHQNSRPGGAVTQNYPGRASANGVHPAQQVHWSATGDFNGVSSATDKAAPASFSQTPASGQQEQPPNFHKPQTGHRPPPQREDAYYSDPSANASRGPISPVHPDAPYGVLPHGRATQQGGYGKAPQRGSPGIDSRRGNPRDPRRGQPPGPRPSRHGPSRSPRAGDDFRGHPREEPRGDRRGDSRPGFHPRDGRPAAPNTKRRAAPIELSARSEPVSRSPLSPRPADFDATSSSVSSASQPGNSIVRKQGSAAGGNKEQGPTGSQLKGRRLSDALPSHPTPVRPGLVQVEQESQQNKAAPIRQYNGQPASIAPSRPQELATRRQSVPVTLEELARLRQDIERRPSDQPTRLQLAKKLVEAMRVLADEGGRADTRTRNKNRERYAAEAHQIVKRLVAEGYPEGQFYMADSLGSGVLGVPNDAKEAFTLYQSAAKSGHAQAAYRTAVCCELGPDEGGGTRRDTLKAFQWYKRAAALGDQPSMYKVGMIQLKGLLGQEINPGEAVTWLKRAVEFADDQNPHAIHELACLYDSRAPQRLIESNDARALELFTKAANFGFKRSQFRLGEAYEYGMLGCPIDARNSIIWYTRAAAQAEHQSELALSGWYLTGSDGILEHSDTEAYLWARKAALAEPPLAKAMFALGYYTEVGIGCPRSLEEAKKWYSRAAAHKFSKAQERLEELRRGGAKVQKNRENLSRRNQRQQEAECSVM